MGPGHWMQGQIGVTMNKKISQKAHFLKNTKPRFALNKKGIGPIIAFVLLMALSVTLGAFVTIWYTKSTEGQAKTVIEKYGNADECSDVRFDVAFNYTTCNSIRVYNLGSFNIDKLKMEILFKDASGDSVIADVNILPKQNVEAEVGPLDCISKIQFAPIIVESGTATQCINDRIFIPEEEEMGVGACVLCPPLP